MLNLVRAWIVLSAALCAGGWTFSMFRRLDAIAYGLLLALLFAAALLWAQRSFRAVPVRMRLERIQQKVRRRFRRTLPLSFFVLACAVVLGGLLYPPVQADALQYRTPRVMYWLAAGQWHWIHAWDLRLNVISCGFEWLTAPLLLFTRTDRWLFIINALSYLMLPGLVFGVFRQLSVRPRVAWAWMWILPSGWVYAMQGGGVSNDHFSAVYSLASVYFALRARETNRLGDLWISLLACVLVTGTKQTNVPLALLWFIAAWPSLRLFIIHPLASLGVAILAALASGLPMAYLDLIHTGTWTGWPKGQDLQPESPFWGIVGNAYVLIAHNFMPPVFPLTAQYNEIRNQFLQTEFGSHFTSFEQFGAVTRAVAEQTTALGLCVCLLALVSVVAAWRIRRGCQHSEVRQSICSVPRLLRIVPWLLLVLFMAKVGSWNAPRYLAPYYPFLFPSLLVSAGHSRLVRTRWWNRAAILGMLVTISLIVLSRQRPLLPVDTVTAHFQKHYPHSNFIRKVRNAYSFRQGLRTGLEPLLNHLPSGERTIGYAARMGGSDIQLDSPLGSRRVLRVKIEDSPEDLRRLGIRYVFVERDALKGAGLTIEEWARRFNAEILGTVTRDYGPEMPVLECHLARLKSIP
jgi:hypothetical protein